MSLDTKVQTVEAVPRATTALPRRRLVREGWIAAPSVERGRQYQGAQGHPEDLASQGQEITQSPGALAHADAPRLSAMPSRMSCSLVTTCRIPLPAAVVSARTRAITSNQIRAPAPITSTRPGCR